MSIHYKNIFLLIDFIHFDKTFFRDIKSTTNIKFKSLFQDTPEEVHIELSPTLIKIDWDKHQELLERIQSLEKSHTACLWIESTSTFSSLYKVLKDKMYIKLEDKQKYLFRFYDVKCIESALQLFSQYPQHKQDLKIVKTWSYWDMDKQERIDLTMSEA